MKRKNRNDLNLDYRMNIIIKELKSLNADIICLQETNLNSYRKYILPEFGSFYTFEYGENYGSNFINVIGFKKNKFNLIYRKSLDLWHIDVEGNRGVYNVILEDIFTKQEISIYNVHFPWRPEYDLDKCYFLDSIAEHIFEKNVKNVIIAGDFNSLPNSLLMRLVYYKEFLKELSFIKTERQFDIIRNKFSLLPIDVDRGDLPDTHKLNFIIKNLHNISTNPIHEKKFISVFHNLKLLHDKFCMKSAYSQYKANPESSEKFMPFITEHPNYTNFTENFKNTIDYILYSSSLTLNKILKLPERDELIHEQFLPSSKFPSDHLKLCAEFSYN